MIRQESNLVLWTAAQSALAAAVSIDEVKDIRDRSLAMALYARQANDKDMLANAMELRRRAERRLGEMMVASPMAPVGRPPKNRFPENPFEAPPTKQEIGIDKNLAHRARTAAAIPAAEFEAIIKEEKTRIADESDRLTRRIHNAAVRAETRAQPVIIPAGKYSCIVIDPPWPMEKIERDVRPNQTGFEYPTMTEEELIDFEVEKMAAPDCHLFCWTTQKFLPLALYLIEAWEFRYVCTFVWHKPGGFQPIGLPQYNCEFVVYARVGAPVFVDTKAFPTCFEAPRREHSRKPDEFYEMVRRVTDGPRIDIFSRERREGFAQLGNEIAKFGLAAE